MDVICVDNLDPGVHRRPPDYLRADVDYCFADLRHWVPDRRFDDVEAIVHLAALGGVSRAAQAPADVIGANSYGTARLIGATAAWSRLRRFVLASSFSVYGANYTYRCPVCNAQNGGGRRAHDLEAGRFEVLCAPCGVPAEILPIDVTAAPSPLETYGASKYMQELCFRGFTRCPVSILRFSSVYGSRLRLDDGEGTIIARIIAWIRAGRRPQLFEDGRQIRDWVFVGDVVAAVCSALEQTDTPQVVNVCSGLPTRLLEACERVAQILGVDCPADVVGGYRPGDMRHCLGDASPLQHLLGRPPMAFKEGIELTLGGSI
jgi:dTDP-L-rhamnose 4-epimerase